MRTRLMWALYTAFVAWWSNPYDTQVVLGFFAVCTVWTWGWIILGMHIEAERDTLMLTQEEAYA